MIVGWRPEHAVAVATGTTRGGINSERTTTAIPRESAWLIVGGLLALHGRVRAGCGGATTTARRQPEPTCRSVGKGEGELNLVNWAGYVEDGRLRPEVRLGDAVREADRLPGQRTRSAGTSDEMVQLMRTGQYDGVSASGNATARLVDGGDVDPVNVDLVPNYKDVFPDAQGPAVQHVRRRPLRDPARPRGEPADVEHGRRQAGADVVGRHPRPEARRRSTRARSAPTTTRSTSPMRPCT